MINMNELAWGLHPDHEIEALAAFGARTIFQNENKEVRTRKDIKNCQIIPKRKQAA